MDEGTRPFGAVGDGGKFETHDEGLFIDVRVFRPDPVPDANLLDRCNYCPVRQIGSKQSDTSGAMGEPPNGCTNLHTHYAREFIGRERESQGQRR